MLVTLAIDGQAPVTALWYPGFLTANAFTATGDGLVWGVNHIPVVRPGLTGAGRHFVARAMQQAPTLDAAVAHLRAHPSAGGYAYTIGERASGRVAVVEAVAGHVTVTEAGPTQPLRWHTNHLRHRSDPADAPALLGDSPAARAHASRYQESLARGRALAALEPPGGAPATPWFMEPLTSAPLPHGVHRTAAGADPLMTLCTLIADLSSGSVTLRGRSGETGQLALSAFIRGTMLVTDRARPTDELGVSDSDAQNRPTGWF
ncbi:carcinine hydrolase/isopenicillin-N N-acyltransferase family protein [Streptomyces sp. NPDC059037]|uniref:carcinine hydrolase/isopenicillin-N N-acyltransferase family protein n=1 Tax=Streptomyces sp. NPDC059037 TaxID=3346710 RepID=UPI0036965BDF